VVFRYRVRFRVEAEDLVVRLASGIGADALAHGLDPVLVLSAPHAFRQIPKND
jgi:hypothetical protein